MFNFLRIIKNNPLTHSLFSQENDEGIPPSPPGQSYLINNENYVLVNNESYGLVGDE